MNHHKYLRYLAIIAIFTITGCKSSETKKDDPLDKIAAMDKETASRRQRFPAVGMIDLLESKNFENILCQQWDNKEDAADARSFQEDTDLELVNRGYCFFNDGTMVKNPRGEYTEGNWVLKKEKKPYVLEMKYKNGGKESFTVEKIEPKALTLKEISPNKNAAYIEYKADAVGFTENKYNPLYTTNNTWRIAPSKAETTKQLQERLKGSVHFFVMYYDYCITSNAEDVNFTGFPTCFKWYAGGIFLQKEKNLKPGWINCFYNKTQAQECYKLAEKLVSHKYTWPKGERNWVKQNVFVLKQMEKKLEEGLGE